MRRGYAEAADGVKEAAYWGVKRDGPPVPVKSHTVVVPYPSGAVEQPAEVQKASYRACFIAKMEFVRICIRYEVAHVVHISSTSLREGIFHQ